MTDALVQARQVGVLNRQRRRRVAPAPLLFLVKKVASRLTATNHKTNGTFVTVDPLLHPRGEPNRFSHFEHRKYPCKGIK